MREDAKENLGQYYNEEYYSKAYDKQNPNMEYQYGKGWEEIFEKIALRIGNEINPKKTLDVGCALGFLVEQLKKRDVQAYGIDISEYIISQIKDELKPYCKVKSILEPIEEKYDLITCIEVFEHLEHKDIPKAIKNLCDATDDIIFSSTPFEYSEESHVSVNPPEYWVEQFMYNGFYHDIDYDCSYISVQAMRFRRGKKNVYDIARAYEKYLFQTRQEIIAVRENLRVSQENLNIYKSAYQEHVDKINNELIPEINELNGIISVKDQLCNESIEKITSTLKDEYESKLNQYIVENDKKIEDITCDCNLEIEKAKKHYMQMYQEEIIDEIKKRKDYEEMYRLMKEKIDQYISELKLARQKEERYIQEKERYRREGYEKNEMLEKVRYSLDYIMNLSRTINIKKIIKYRKSKKKLDRKLLSKPLEYWKPVFDSCCYVKYNSDIADKYGNDQNALLQHFILYGMSEGRKANEFFDVNVYMGCNPDIMESCGVDRRLYYLHYIENGIYEKRKSF